MSFGLNDFVCLLQMLPVRLQGEQQEAPGA